MNASAFFLDRHLENGRGGSPAIFFEGEVYSYDDLFYANCQTANLFTGAGIIPGDRVQIILPDSPLFVACFLGLLRIGAIPSPISTRFSDQDYLRILTDCQPRAIITSEAHLPVLSEIRYALSSIEFFWVAGVADPYAELSILSLTEGMSRSSDHHTPPDLPADRIGLIQYTSGSTGAPKGVAHRYENLVKIADGISRRLEISAKDAAFSASKMSFGYGLGNSIWLPLAGGGSTILYPGIVEPFTISNILENSQPTIFYGMPALYSEILKLHEANVPFDFSTVRLCVSAGEYLSPALVDRWQATFGLRLTNCFGATECLHVFIATVPGETVAETIGKRVEGYEIAIRDENGVDCAPGEHGQLHIRSSLNSMGYWNQETHSVIPHSGDWFCTRDVCRVDEAGYFYYLGRADDVVNIGGVKIAPYEIEVCIGSHGDVKRAAVVGQIVDDVTKLVAYVELNEGISSSAKLISQLKRLAKRQLSPFKQPYKIEVVDELPRTATGKLTRAPLR